MSVPPIDRSLQKIKFLTRIAGLNMEDREKTWSEISRNMFHLIWVATDIVLGTEWIIEGAINGINFVELTHVMPCFAMGVMATIKTLFYVLYEKKVRAMINTIRNLEKTRVVTHPLGEKIVKEETKFLYLLIRVLIIVNVILLLMFNIGPLIIIAVKYYMTGEVELILPFLDVYPFDAYDLRFWPFAYVHELWTASIVITLIFAIDFFFYICCAHIRVQFKLLQKEIVPVIPKTMVPGDGTKEKMKELVKWHQSVISCADMLEAIYSKSTLFNYLTSSLIICLTGFNVMALQDMAIVVTFATIAFVGIIQIFFLCYFGDMLMISSVEVSSAAYNCNWYIADTSIRKTVLMIQTRAQTPCRLTAAGYADVNLKAFMKILSTSWSYFALLQTMYGSFEDE